MALLHELMPLACQASLFLLALAVGLDCGIDDALHGLRRPGLLVRALQVLSTVPLREVRRGAHKARVYGLLVAAGALALVTAPLAAALLGAMPGRQAALAPLAAVGVVVVVVFVPLAAGMAIRVVAPAAAARVVPAIGKCAGLMLFLAGLAAVALSLRA